MRVRRLWLALAILLALGALLLTVRQPQSAAGGPVVINGTAVPPVPTLNPAAVAQGGSLYARNCAKCHGANLEGAPDWKRPLADGSYPPPPHDNSGHTWHHPDSLLARIVANGGDPAYNSKMPAFGAELSDKEISAILEFIKSKWGADERQFQWWVTASRQGS